MDSIRQLNHDIEELKVDISMVVNEELKVYIRALIFEKQKTVLALMKEYGLVEE